MSTSEGEWMKVIKEGEASRVVLSYEFIDKLKKLNWDEVLQNNMIISPQIDEKLSCTSQQTKASNLYLLLSCFC